MENKVIENARASLSGLSGDERREALRALRRLIDEELFGLATEGESDGGPSDSCPRCGSWKVAERGIPRAAHKRHEGVDNCGQICVLTGVNDAGDMFFEIAGRGNIDSERAEAFLDGKVGSGAIVSTDGSRAYPRAMKSLDARRHEASPSEAHAINVVNNLHSRLRGFLDRFRSVATRRLWSHLAWFKWIWCFKAGRTAEEVADMVVRHVAGGSYRTTWRQCKNTPYPFYDYWEKQAGWDSAARAALPLASLGA